MQRRHIHRTVTADEAESWLGHLSDAMEECGVDGRENAAVVAKLTPAAYRLVNGGATFPSVRIAVTLAGRGDLSGIKECVGAQPSLLVQRGGDGMTLLWAAARRGQREVGRAGSSFPSAAPLPSAA